jgi:hypothetical protein
MFESKAGTYPSKALLGDPHLGMLLALPANVRPDRVTRNKHSSFAHFVGDEEK